MTIYAVILGGLIIFITVILFQARSILKTMQQLLKDAENAKNSSN